MRSFIISSIVGLALMSFATISPAVCATTSAPADEYFGHYHLSILGIRNALTDMTRKAHENPDRASAFMNSAGLTEDAIHQWQTKYPNDSWLPKSVFALERLYVTIGTKDAAEQAIKTAAWIDKSFPQTIYPQMGRQELASLTTSDDGNVSTPDSPAMLGMVPALTEDTNSTVPPSVDAQAPNQSVPSAVAANDNIPSYAYRNAGTPLEIQGPRAVDIIVKQ